MHYYLALTSKCNLLCKYCYGKSVEDYLSKEEEEKYDFDLPSDINFSIYELKDFAKKDSDFAITFYGGEPLLKIDLIKQIIDNVPSKTFMIQTNGILLDKLSTSYVNILKTILVSIDGSKIHTNERRGMNVYEKVISNLNLIRENGFEGEIIARMTIDETSDIYENVMYLYNNADFKFDSIHWQIDAQFWKSDYEQRDFKKWLVTNYNPGIKKLVDWWASEIKKTKKIPKLYPFVGIIHSLLNNEKSLLKCGAGHSLLGIQTNGKVVACPITAGYKPFEMGDIRSSSLYDIKSNVILPQNTCLKCEIKNICGGRCLYANNTKLWGEIGFEEVCYSIFFLVNTLKSKLPQIKELIDSKTISIHDFDFDKYNGTEIIP